MQGGFRSCRERRAVRTPQCNITYYCRKLVRGNSFSVIAKSNTSGLHSREPVYRDLRELVMSYFVLYLNMESKKALRSYSDLWRPKDDAWMTAEDHITSLGDVLDLHPHVALLSPIQIKELMPAGSTASQSDIARLSS
jgi:hypothetical protein